MSEQSSVVQQCRSPPLRLTFLLLCRQSSWMWCSRKQCGHGKSCSRYCKCQVLSSSVTMLRFPLCQLQ